MTGSHHDGAEDGVDVLAVAEHGQSVEEAVEGDGDLEARPGLGEGDQGGGGSGGRQPRDA
jgi:hypothetical protein